MIIQFLNQLEGANSSISPFLQPPNSPPVLNGVNVSYKLGAVLKDTGYTIVGSALQANKSILGLYNFRQTASTQKMLATVDDSSSDDTQLFYSTGGNWTEIAAAETAWANYANMKVEMEAFIGYCFFVGYGSTDGFLPVASLTDTTFSTSTNVTSMPQAKYITRYRDRLYIFNCKYSGTEYGFRCYYSSVPSAGAITWTPASDFIDVDYSEAGTGIAEAWDRLLLFTETSTTMYDQSFKKKVWDIGGYQRTIQKHGSFLYFANSDGVWVSTGGNPEPISGNVIDFFRNGDPSTWLSALVEEEYHIYVGTVTVNGRTYTNTLLTFNLPTQSWRWRELGHSITSLARYLSSGRQSLWMGDSIGKVYKKGKYTDDTLLSSDNGESISVDFELAPFYVGNLGFENKVAKITAFADRALGLKLKARVIDRNSRSLTPYEPLGELKAYVNRFDINVDDGVLLQISGSENGTNPYFSFLGVEIEAKPISEVIQK